jgi:hypothetical protein
MEAWRRKQDTYPRFSLRQGPHEKPRLSLSAGPFPSCSMLDPATLCPTSWPFLLTSAHSWKYTMTMLICEQDTTRMMKTRNRKPKR